MMSTLYGEPLLFKSKYVCNRSCSIQAPSSTTKVDDVQQHVISSGFIVTDNLYSKRFLDHKTDLYTSYDSILSVDVRAYIRLPFNVFLQTS